MEIEPQSQLNSKSPLMEVTPLSKYLAMALFVTLPFIGGWIGYKYAPEKIVEVDQIVYRKTEPVVSTTNETTSADAVLSPYEKRLQHIEKLKSDPNLKIDNIYDLQSVVTFKEFETMYASARKYVTENSIEGMQFSLVFNWRKGEWVNFMVIPENVETDNAQIFMQKESGQWILKGFGTAFPDLYVKHPELFDE